MSLFYSKIIFLLIQFNFNFEIISGVYLICNVLTISIYLGCNGSYSRRLQKRKEVLQKVYYWTYKPWSRLVAQNKHWWKVKKLQSEKQFWRYKMWTWKDVKYGIREKSSKSCHNYLQTIKCKFSARSVICLNICIRLYIHLVSVF